MKKTICFFGDSTCVGQGVSIYNGWVSKIAEALYRFGLSKEMELIVSNSSVNGRTSRQALEDMPYHVQSQKPNVLLIQFGLNDCNYWKTDNGVPRVSPLAFRGNLFELVERAQRSQVETIFLNNNHPTSRDNVNVTDELSYEDSNRMYNQIIREVASELGSSVNFNDIEKTFLEKVTSGIVVNSFLLEDGLHLNEAGHQLYFDLLYPKLKRCFC